MALFGRGSKVWILITLCCLLAWLVYWLPSSIDRFFGFQGIPWSEVLQREGGLMFMLLEVSGGVGILLRFFGVLAGIFVVSSLIYNKSKGFFDFKNFVAFSFSMESLYFLFLIPSAFALLGFGGPAALTSYLLGVDYALMILLTAPFLAVLAFKLLRFKGDAAAFNERKWISLAFVGYVAALWANSVIKWFDMIFAEGFSFFTLGLRALGAVNAFIFMSLALLFSILTAFSLAKTKTVLALKWSGLALALIGLHFIVFAIYSYLVDMMSFLMLAEIWTIPLVGLGIVMLISER